MKKTFTIFAGVLATMPLAMHALDDYNFEFLNKLSIPIEYSIGNRIAPPTFDKMRTIKPGETAQRFVNRYRTPQVLFREKGKQEMAILYEFPKTAEIVHIKVEPTKDGGYDILPQTTWGISRGGNVSKDEIKVIGTRGIMQKHAGPSQPEPIPVATKYEILGIKNGASDAEILGVSQAELKNKAAVKKAYRKLSLLWHPDKADNNARYAQADVQRLSDQQRNDLINEVFVLIKDAYERHN